jgi:hypothetical protein
VGTFSSTAIEIIKWVKKIALAQAKVTHILRPGKASEKTQKGVIQPSLCEISQNAIRKKKKKVVGEVQEANSPRFGHVVSWSYMQQGVIICVRASLLCLVLNVNGRRRVAERQR